MDPIRTAGVSPYVVFDDNPIYYNDPLGNYRTWAGAQLGKILNGGTTVGKLDDPDNKHHGQWYYNKNRTGKKASKSGELDETIATPNHYGGKSERRGKVGSGGLNGVQLDDFVDKIGQGVNDVANTTSQISSDAWNSPLARMIVPDYLTFSLSGQTSSGVYASEDLTLTLLLRGKDPGLYFNTTTGGGGTLSSGVDGGISFGRGYYLGDVSNLSSDVFGGWQSGASFSPKAKLGAGLGLNFGGDVGYYSNGQPATMTIKAGVSGGLGIATPINGTVGGGYSTPAIRLIKFK